MVNENANAEARAELQTSLTLAAILTATTCGEACWRAAEDVCRCSCGGKNHGCLRSEGGQRPTRTAKIGGYRYELTAVGAKHSEASAINKASGPRYVDPDYYGDGSMRACEYDWHETDEGAPARLKPATRDQIAKWPELAAYRDMPPYKMCYLLWVRID